MSKQKKYAVTVPFRGQSFYLVDANSAKEAKDLVDAPDFDAESYPDEVVAGDFEITHRGKAKVKLFEIRNEQLNQQK